MKTKKIIILVIVGIMLLALAGCSSSSDDYPKRSIKLVVPFGPGGGSDQFARILEKEIEAASDIDLTVVNMPGAKTAVGFESFMAEPADGYTIMIATTDTVINLTQGITNADINDIEPIVVPQLNVDMLFINANDSRFSNFEEMVAYSKDNNVELEIATLGVDGSEFLTISEIENVTGAKFSLIPYSEPGERYAALAGGHVDVLFEQPGDILAFLDSGEYLPVISMSEQRITGFDDTPCSVELGINITNGYWRSVLVKSDVPEEYKDVIREAITTAINTEGYSAYASEKYLDLRKGYFDKESAKEFFVSEFEYYSQD